MTSALNGFMLGDPVNNRWSLWKTTNGGANWDSTGLNLLSSSPGEAGLNNCLYVNGTNICFCTSASKIYYSSNSGINWVPQSVLGGIDGIWFNDSVGLTGGDANFNKTINNGMNWTSSLLPRSGSVYGVTGRDSSFLIVSRSGYIYFSPNNGVSFTTADFVSGNNYLAVSTSRNGNTVWAVGMSGKIRKGVKIFTEVKSDPIIAKTFKLYQNYPNPFNPTTTINYSLPKGGYVRLMVFNSIGSKVANIVDGYKPSGDYSVSFNGSNLTSGIYIYRLESGNYIASKKFILMK